MSDEEQKTIYDFLVSVMPSSYFIVDVIKNQHFRMIMGKSVYLLEFFSWEVGWPLKWKPISFFIEINYIYRKIFLLSDIFPGNFPGNNGKNDLWRHNDVTWSDFRKNFRERDFHLNDDSVKISGHFDNPNGSYSNYRFPPNYRNPALCCVYASHPVD